MKSSVCADCGVPIVLFRNKWASPSRHGTYSFTCRYTAEGIKLLTADYHYVKGEKQRHLSFVVHKS